MRIDLSKLPEGTTWIAIDKDGSGEVSAFKEMPILNDGGFYMPASSPCQVIGYLDDPIDP